MPPTGPFGGYFEFSPSNAMFLSLSLEICKLSSYSQTESPVAARGQFLRVTLVPWEVLVPPTGLFGGCFEFSPSNAMFLSLSLEICPNYHPILKLGSPAYLRGQFLRVTLAPVGGVGATHGVVRGLF